MITIEVQDREGQSLALECEEGDPLMHTLRDNVGIEATCGGTASCGTCHVYVEERWMSALPPMDDEESMLLEGLISTRDNSRIACKVLASHELNGLQLVLAPED